MCHASGWITIRPVEATPRAAPSKRASRTGCLSPWKQLKANSARRWWLLKLSPCTEAPYQLDWDFLKAPRHSEGLFTHFLLPLCSFFSFFFKWVSDFHCCLKLFLPFPATSFFTGSPLPPQSLNLDSLSICFKEKLNEPSTIIFHISFFNFIFFSLILQFSSVQSLIRVQLFATPWIAARQASLSITNSRSSLRLTTMESVMPSDHLILCRTLLLLPPIHPSIRVFSNESALRMRWPKYWSFSFSIFNSYYYLISSIVLVHLVYFSP